MLVITTEERRHFELLTVRKGASFRTGREARGKRKCRHLPVLESGFPTLGSENDAGASPYIFAFSSVSNSSTVWEKSSQWDTFKGENNKGYKRIISKITGSRYSFSTQKMTDDNKLTGITIAGMAHKRPPGVALTPPSLLCPGPELGGLSMWFWAWKPTPQKAPIPLLP